jgi:hypothetical protein
MPRFKSADFMMSTLPAFGRWAAGPDAGNSALSVVDEGRGCLAAESFVGFWAAARDMEAANAIATENFIDVGVQ